MSKEGLVAAIRRFPFRSLFVIVAILLMQFFTKLASTITMHPGPVLIDTIFDKSGGVEIIVGEKEIPAECLGKEHQ